VNVLSNNKGFSLIELMVVVAIIAILSTIAIPSYQNFQAKSRQKEGFALLGAYFTAAQATRAELGIYPGNFVGTGFSPTGQLGYRVTAVNGAVPQYGSNDPACVVTTAACACGGSCPNFRTWDERPAVADGLAPAAPVGCAPATASGAGTFIVVASGIIRAQAGATADTYSMNQRKVLQMCNDGIN
jgi:prepilin-type N-terminal cleavage/methylation domain-containing protein